MARVGKRRLGIELALAFAGAVAGRPERSDSTLYGMGHRLFLNNDPSKEARRKFGHAVLAYGLLEGVATAPNRRRIAAATAYAERSIDRYAEEVRAEFVQAGYRRQDLRRSLASLASADPMALGGVPPAPLTRVAYRPPVVDDAAVRAEVDRRLHRAFFEEKTKQLH